MHNPKHRHNRNVFPATLLTGKCCHNAKNRLDPFYWPIQLNRSRPGFMILHFESQFNTEVWLCVSLWNYGIVHVDSPTGATLRTFLLLEINK